MSESHPNSKDSRHQLTTTHEELAISRRRNITHARQGSGSKQPTQSGITPLFVWRVFRNWWKFLVPCSLLLAVAAAALVLWLHVPQYEARALIKIESNIPYIAFDSNNSNSRDSDRYVQTQIETMKSPIVLGPLLSRPSVSEIEEINSEFDPQAYIREHLSVRQVGKSELYEVAYTSSSADDAATVANYVVAEYMTVENDETDKRTNMVINTLREELKDREGHIEQLRTRVVDLAKDVTGRDPFGQGAIVGVTAFSPSTSVYQELTETEVSLEVAKAELQALKTSDIISADNAIATGHFELEISNRADVRRLEDQIRDIEQQITEIKSKPRPRISDTWEKDPDYLRVNALLIETRRSLTALREHARTELAQQQLERNKQESEQAILSKQQEITTLAKKLELLEIRRQEHVAELEKGGARSAELDIVKSELEREQNVFELISARKLALETERGAPTRASLMHTASPPRLSIEPIPFKLLAIACLSALIAPLGLATVREVVVKRVCNADELANETQLPLLGEVACLPVRKVGTRHQLMAPNQHDLLVYTESIDSLRTTLALTEGVGVRDCHKTVAVCSGVSGEGKTNISTALAMSIAHASKMPTLIIDADLRSPDVSEYLDVPSGPGLSEVISGSVPLNEAIYRVGDSLTFVLPAGSERINPHQVVEGSAIPDLLRKLGKRFSTVIIDTPPVLSASEALVYAKASDLVVYCSLSDVSRARQVRLATEKLEATGARIAGTVLSGVSTKSYVYAYGRYASLQGQA
ncbi:polysaccharide biosynthesis tyrosine autokinase [Aeoliella mucimassa]|uniref:Tyrosine-protein kinase ptk n=1 Tax=Aeoliella mucimassa TaxID=2527972 RepID=A0A518ALT3_9BACT|nr:hypothetical protein [Aeoliella mucimassa]QDU55668.1 Tyrosine-protein kinase ptk [Aeoliella mucimassa]